jgi:hypothetical protein
MAYDDVLARACMFQQAKSFHTRTTAGALNDKYRSNQAFDSTAISSVEDALRLLALAQSTYGRPLRLNKATLLSWLLFATENAAIGRNGHLFARYIAYFDRLQIEAKRQAAGGTLLKKQWLRFYQDRASSRVNDTLSVAGRDFVLWLFFADSRIPPEKITSKLDVAAQVLDRLERDVSDRDYLDPQGFVEALLDQRVWDLANARS